MVRLRVGKQKQLSGIPDLAIPEDIHRRSRDKILVFGSFTEQFDEPAEPIKCFT